MLQEIQQVLNGINVTTEKVTAQTPKLTEHEMSLRKEIRTLNLLMMTFERFAGDDRLSGIINKIQQVMQVVMRLRLTILALAAASGPWGWLYAGANVLATGIAIGNLGQ